jgi:hypothetical protein
MSTIDDRQTRAIMERWAFESECIVSENPIRSMYNKLLLLVEPNWHFCSMDMPDAGSGIREIKHLAEGAKPPWLAFGTELKPSVPSAGWRKELIYWCWIM